MTDIKGYCPMGCGQTLIAFAHEGGRIECSNVDCPTPDAVDRILDNPTPDHTIADRHRDDAAADYPAGKWCPKIMREHLCAQATFAPDDIIRDAFSNLIRVLDLHRPIGPDGKHGNRHTPTCGCEGGEAS